MSHSWVNKNIIRNPVSETSLYKIVSYESNKLITNLIKILGEEERCVSLCWRTSRGGRVSREGGWHKPRAAYGLSILEYPTGQSHWKGPCPFAPAHHAPLPIESQDLGALYYRNYFYNQRKYCM